MGELENVRKMVRDMERNQKNYDRVMEHAEESVLEMDKRAGQKQCEHELPLFIDAVMAQLKCGICSRDWQLVAQAQVMLGQMMEVLLSKRG